MGITSKYELFCIQYVRSGPFVYKNKDLLKKVWRESLRHAVFSPGVTFCLKQLKQSVSEGSAIFAMLAKNFGERHTLIFSYVLSQRLFLTIYKFQMD